MTAGELLRLLDSYVNRIDPDYINHRYDFLNAGHRWVEQKFHFREAQYQKWQMTESLPPAWRSCRCQRATGIRLRFACPSCRIERRSRGSDRQTFASGRGSIPMVWSRTFAAFAR